MEPSLVIMAAGLGSRFGGLKQLTPVGPFGETLLDYSIYDARRAGFKKVVFVIQTAFSDAFKDKILPAALQWMDSVELVYQDETFPIIGVDVPGERSKPFGTAHAVLSAAPVIHEPFAVINADDFYGASAFSSLYEFLSNPLEPDEFCMVGYVLKNTLSENGSVSRGICEQSSDGCLTGVAEYVGIRHRSDGVHAIDPMGEPALLSENAIVSLNTWGFTPALFPTIQAEMDAFLSSGSMEDLLSGECYLPAVVDAMIQAKTARVKIIPSHNRWYGVTYQEDLDFVKDALAEMTEEGLYPRHLAKSIEESRF